MRLVALHVCCSLPDARHAQGGSSVDEKMLRPVFRQVPSDQEVHEGQTVRLEFTLNGRLTPRSSSTSATHASRRTRTTRCVASSVQLDVDCICITSMSLSPSSRRARFRDACELAVLQMVVNEEGVHPLLLLRVEPSDAGAYTCVARNPAGEATFAVTLRVTPRSRSEAPHFLEKPVSLIVPEGEPASFVCRAAGTPAPAFS